MGTHIERRSDVDSSVTACVILDRDGEPCGRPGQAGLPAGVCRDHAIKVYRAVVALGKNTGGGAA